MKWNHGFQNVLDLDVNAVSSHYDFGTGEAVPADLSSRTAAARRARVETNRSASRERCPSLNVAA